MYSEEGYNDKGGYVYYIPTMDEEIKHEKMGTYCAVTSLYKGRIIMEEYIMTVFMMKVVLIL